MISYLRGQLVFADDVESENLTIDVHGVGYEVICSQVTRQALESKRESKLDDEIELHVYTHVREEAITLFGFSSIKEKQLFLTLIKVNGVGPKMAIAIMSGAPVERIFEMIETEDVRALTQLPKVGKKTAEQLVLSLKGKLPKLDFIEKGGRPRLGFIGRQGEILSALVNLGFRSSDVEKIVSEMDPQIKLEDGVRQGLQRLSGM